MTISQMLWFVLLLTHCGGRKGGVAHEEYVNILVNKFLLQSGLKRYNEILLNSEESGYGEGQKHAQ